MFAELLPILRNRAVMITIGLVNGESVRVHVIPKLVKNDDSGDCALASPLTVTGTAEELDRDFAAQLAGFTNSFVKLGSNLSEIEASHATAVKAVEAEKKKDLENRRKGTASRTSPAATSTSREPELKVGKPVFGSKTTAAAAPLSLFDSREPGQSDAQGGHVTASQAPMSVSSDPGIGARESSHHEETEAQRRGEK